MARVSTATVSRVLNEQSGVGATVRKRVLRVMRKLDYAPRAAARQLSSRRNDTIGVIFQDLTPGWFVSTYLGIYSRLRGYYHVLTSLSSREADEFDLARQVLAERRVDGLIWMDPRLELAPDSAHTTSRMIRELNRMGVPIVVLQLVLDDPSINTICVDSRAGAREGMKHLLGLGHRRILIVTGPPKCKDSERKMEGVRLALSESRLELKEDQVIIGHHVGHHAVCALEDYLKRHKMPEAIFSFNDDMAIAMLVWLRGRGVRVPEDVALVGYDGVPESAYLGLTTVEMPLFDMGAMAAHMLIETLEHPQLDRPARQVSLQGTLRIRDTSGVPTSDRKSDVP